MRRLGTLLFVIIGSVCNEAKPQTVDTLSIYTNAIIDLIDYRQTKGDNSVIYLDAGLAIMADLVNDQIEKSNVVLITSENKKTLYRENNNSLTHWTIFPAKVKNGKVTVTVTPYHGKRKGRRYFLSVSDGYTLVYAFNCETRYYELANVEEWGI